MVGATPEEGSRVVGDGDGDAGVGWGGKVVGGGVAWDCGMGGEIRGVVE